MDEINRLANDIRSHLKRMNTDLKQAKDDTNAIKRTKLNQYGALSKRFLQVIEDYDSVQTKYKQQTQQRFARQARIGIFINIFILRF